MQLWSSTKTTQGIRIPFLSTLVYKAPSKAFEFQSFSGTLCSHKVLVLLRGELFIINQLYHETRPYSLPLLRNPGYALGGDGNLICADAATGDKIWERHLLKTYGGRNINWGISESPLVDGNRLIVNAGGRGASIVALDKPTGRELWKTQSDEAGYSSAVAVVICSQKVCPRPELVQLNPDCRLRRGSVRRVAGVGLDAHD